MKRIATPVIIVLFLGTLFTAFRLEAQGLTKVEPAVSPEGYLQAPAREQVFLQIDRGMYIAGEDVWFSIYTVDPETGKLSDLSAVAYIELLNPWNMPLVQSRFHLTGGRGEGSFLLPDSVSSGTYTIRAYTNWIKNFLPDDCYMQDIDICNPFRSFDFWRKADPAGSSDKRLINLTDKKKRTVDLRADTIYNRREKVTLKVRISNDIADQPGISEMSIAVTPAEIATDIRWEKSFMNVRTDPKQYSFEREGHYLSGRIKYRESNFSDFSNFLFMSIQGKVADFKYAVIDSAGRFTFTMPVDDKMRNLILQPENANSNMILEIEPSFSWILPETNSYRDSFSDSQLDVFSDLSFNYQAAKIYGSIRKEPVTDGDTALKKRRFYGIPEMEIFLDDYISLPVMQEVFFELLPGIILRSRKTGYELKITNPLTGNFYAEQPLVMIDGVIINDLTVLADLNPEIVEKIEVVKTPYLTGDLILHGIVNVITRSGDFSNMTMPDYAVVLPYRVIDKPWTFNAPDYTDEQNNPGRVPDLRNTLYWNPSVKTDIKGEVEIEFWTSDLPGNYTINIKGISGTGEILSLVKSFMVR